MGGDQTQPGVPKEAVKRCNQEHDRSSYCPSWAPRSMAPTSRWLTSTPLSTNSRRRAGLDVQVHVDGASGAFVAPFLDPDLVWNFALPRVQSINASGRGSGCRSLSGYRLVVSRNQQALPDDLVFKVNYLGGEMPTFALDFTATGNQIVAEYYNLIRLGFDGYRHIQQSGTRRGHRDGGADRPDWVRSGSSSDEKRRPRRRFRPEGPQPTTRCSTCPSCSGRTAGWCPPTPSRRTGRTWPCSGWW